MTLQAWLDSERDYEVGRQLYEQLGDNSRLKQVLGHGPNSYNEEALAWELGKLASMHVTDIDVGHMPKKVQADPIQKAESSPNATETLQSAPPQPENPLLDDLRLARRPLYDERTLLHGQLELLAETKPQDEVRQMGVRIMAISRELNANWKLDAYVREHGQLPPPAPAAPGLDTLSPVELLKKRNTLRSQVSKLKKNPARADDLVQAQTDLSVVEALLRHE